MTTSRMTLSTLLGTVNEAATTVTTTFNTATQAVNMLNRYVTEAATKQQVRSLIDMDNYVEMLRAEKAQEQAIVQNQIVEFCNQSENHKALYQRNYDRITKLLVKNKIIDAEESASA